MDAPAAERAEMPFFPLFISLDKARVVVVGAGAVAARKVKTLLEHGATITVIAPDADEAILDWAKEGRLEYFPREYAHGDLKGALLTVAAASDQFVNEAVAAEAKDHSQLVNVVDVPELCNCIVPSVLRRGRLQVAVSTGGASPLAARELRLQLEERVPNWWEAYLDLAFETRSLIRERIPASSPARKAMLKELGSCSLRARFAEDERPTAEEVFSELSAMEVETI